MRTRTVPNRAMAARTRLTSARSSPRVTAPAIVAATRPDGLQDGLTTTSRKLPARLPGRLCGSGARCVPQTHRSRYGQFVSCGVYACAVGFERAATGGAHEDGD